MLEEVKRVFSRFEIHFKSTNIVGLDFLVAGTHVEYDLFFIAGFHVFFLNGPKNQQVHRKSVGEQHFPHGGSRLETLKSKIQTGFRKLDQFARLEKFLMKGKLIFFIISQLSQFDGLFVSVILRTCLQRVFKILEINFAQTPLNDSFPK